MFYCLIKKTHYFSRIVLSSLPSPSRMHHLGPVFIKPLHPKAGPVCRDWHTVVHVQEMSRPSITVFSALF